MTTLIFFTSSDQKKYVHNKNCVDSFSKLVNGMYQLAFLGKIDFYAVKNRQIRYLWMLKIHFQYHAISQIWIKVQINSFCPFFSLMGQKLFVDTLKNKNFICLKICHLHIRNKICYIKIKELEFYQFIWEILIEYCWSY
jgi:hypothetical protein